MKDKMISEEYKALLEQTHNADTNWGTTAAQWNNHILNLTVAYKTRDILDYGCGKQELEKQLPFKVQKYDPGIKKHSCRPDASDLVLCIDVLEHIEPDYIDNVLNDLAKLTKKAAFFVISTTHAIKHLPDGRNAHLIVENADWWTNKILKYFSLKKFEKISDKCFITLCEPKVINELELINEIREYEIHKKKEELMVNA